jgi:hypothetical protein
MSIERQLQNIQTKAHLHAWIDELPDDAKGLVLMEYHDPENPSDPGGFHASFSYGDMTQSALTWLAQNYVYRAIKHANNDCCKE